MPEEDKMPAWADALVKRLDSIEKADKERRDSEEEAKKKADSEKKKDEDGKKKLKEEEEKERKEKEEAKKKADAEAEAERKEKEEKADSARVMASMKAEIEALHAKLAPLSNIDRDALSSAQAKADSVAQMFGDSASAPLFGESPIAYRKRLVEKFKQHSKDFSEVKLDSLDGAAFDVIEAKIYADAQAAAMAPSGASGVGRLMPIVTKENGREVTRYTGDPMVWMSPFISPSVGVSINNKGA